MARRSRVIGLTALRRIAWLTTTTLGLAAALVVTVLYGIHIISGQDQRTLHQGLWREATNKLTGGHYRVMMRCPLYGRRAAQLLRARTLDEARHKLAWQLPVCDLQNVSPMEREGPFESWYRGTFTCPADYYRRPVALSAPDLDSAVNMAQHFARGCQPEFADQLDCPLLDSGCDKGSIDFRQARQLSGSALR